MPALKTRIPEVLERYEAEILAEWIKEQLAATTQRPDLMKESELHAQSTKFLKLLRHASRERFRAGQPFRQRGYFRAARCQVFLFCLRVLP